MGKRVTGIISAIIITALFATLSTASPAEDTTPGGFRDMSQVYAQFEILHLNQIFENPPGFFAGAYMSSGGMTLLIVESNLQQAHDHDVIGPLLDAGVRYRLVQFSYSQLHDTMDAISANMGEYVPREIRHRRHDWCRYSYNISWFGVTTMDNIVTVGIVEYNEAMSAGVRQHIYDSPMLVFEQSGRLCLSGGTVRYIAFIHRTVITIIPLTIAVVLALLARKLKNESAGFVDKTT